MRDLHVVPARAVRRILDEFAPEVVEIVRSIYLNHGVDEGASRARGVTGSVAAGALQVAAPDAPSGAGARWVVSVASERDSAPQTRGMLVLADGADGHPAACMEATWVGAARAAASAVVAIAEFAPKDRALSVAFAGDGAVVAQMASYLVRAAKVARAIVLGTGDEDLARICADADVVLERIPELTGMLDADVVVLAKREKDPYVPSDAPLNAGQLLLNVSLRALPVELVLAANNVLDDVDECLQAYTSPHLAEHATGGRGFVTGALGEVLRGEVLVDPAKPTVFTPFGMSPLDVAVGQFVLRVATARDEIVAVPDFLASSAYAEPALL